MAIRVSSWNVEQRLSDDVAQGERGTPEKIIERIKEIDADVLVLPEAFRDEPAENVNERLAALGYAWEDVPYADRVGGEPGIELYMRVMSRLAIETHQLLRWGDFRGTAAVTVRDPETKNELEVIGVHQSDLKPEYRVEQVIDGIEYINRDQMARLAIGGWNEMVRRDIRAVILGNRAVDFVAHHLPSQFELNEDVRHDDLRGLVMRTAGMARGKALRLLEQATDLRNLDPRHRATVAANIRGEKEGLPSIRLLGLDHAYASPTVKSDGIRIGPDSGSYHRDISTTVTVE